MGFVAQRVGQIMHNALPQLNRGIKLRLAALLLGLALFGSLIVAVTLSSQRQANEVRARLSQVDAESFRIADHFKEALRGVDDKVRGYRIERQPELWNEFLKDSDQLNTWIQTQAPKLKTEHEKEVLNQIDSAYSKYIQLAQALHEKIQATSEPGTSRAETYAFWEQSRRLSDLGQALSRAHYNSRDQLLAHANQTLSQLRLSVLWLLGLLFLCGVALAAGVYRYLVAPLKVKLVENQALIERHEKLASLGMLAAGVAHEIRNPLTAIRAALFMQQKHLDRGSQAANDSQIIEREIHRLERIVSNFLQFARPAEPQLTTFVAESSLAEVHTLLAPQLAESDIELVLVPSPPIRIKADQGQLKQVLINLVQNAADSIGRNGIIALRVRESRQHISNGEVDVAILEVEDNGQGIPPEVEKRLFDPFFTTKESGTGLGLSIAAQIIEKHGGMLQYQTQVNRGTTFGVILPQSLAEESLACPSQPRSC
jgi:signal transduction histidine kinase